MKTGDFVFILLLTLIAQWTPYHQQAILFFFCVLVLNIISILPMYIPRQLEGYTEGSFKPGYVLSTFQYMTDEPLYIMHRSLTNLINGYSYFHTVLVVEYNGKPCILNSSPFFESDRGKSLYKDQIQIVLRRDVWCMYIEPIESYLEEERKRESFIRIFDTSHHVVYDSGVIQQLESEPIFVPHCCLFAAKYLEKMGISRNQSSLSDSFYYTPQYFSGNFIHKKDIRLL